MSSYFRLCGLSFCDLFLGNKVSLLMVLVYVLVCVVVCVVSFVVFGGWDVCVGVVVRVVFVSLFALGFVLFVCVCFLLIVRCLYVCF